MRQYVAYGKLITSANRRRSERSASLKIIKYSEIARNHIFIPLACEVTGVWCAEAVDFLNELGGRISAATGDKRELAFLYQRLSVALQKGFLHIKW